MVHDQDDGGKYVLHPRDIRPYLDSGQLNLTEEEIEDKSKGDVLTKGLIVLQTSWFILQLVARAIEHLPITELEVATLAFAILNGATYAIWWNKPLDVQCPVILSRRTPAVNVEPGADGSVDRERTGCDILLFQLEKHRRKCNCRRRSSVPFFDYGVHNEMSSYTIYILAAVGVVFGGTHCIAWASSFPTASERLLWRVASVLTTVQPIMVMAYCVMDDHVRFPRIIRSVFVTSAFVLYTAARLVLLVLAFKTLRALPPGAYTTVQWTTFVPHI